MFTDDRIFVFSRTGKTESGAVYPCMLSRRNGRYFIHSIEDISASLKDARIYPENSPEFTEAGDFLILRRSADLILRPRKFLRVLAEGRKLYGYSRLLYCPAIGDPYLIPVLAYAGVHVFDDLFVMEESKKGVLYTPLGKLRSDRISYDENMQYVGMLMQALRTSILNGTLRDLVEKYTMSAKAVEILRIVDEEYSMEEEKVFPVRTPFVYANSLQSLNRPDLVRYREKISREYVRPSGLEYALLIPCSARKPYSSSASHRRLINTLGSLRNNLHEIIVTSPVGLVPRELENSYPPRFYDIPVIGKWFEEEKTMILEMLGSYFARNNYKKVIAYIGDDLKFIESALPPGSEVIHGKLTDESGLKQLEMTLRDVKTSSRLDARSRLLMDMISQAAFQFGSWIVPYLENSRITMSYNQQMISVNGKVLLVYNDSLGKFTITKAMGELFLKEGRYVVSIDDFKPTANVYPVGITGVTEDIRPEDEVVIAHRDSVRGVGIARMPVLAMKTLKKGVAVKVR